MADFRDVRCSTNAEPGANETQFAGHLLSNPRRWPCGHLRTEENTQSIGKAGVRCRLCRRRIAREFGRRKRLGKFCPLQWAKAEEETRRRWGSLTPYRLGLIVASTRIPTGAPRDKSAHWHELYRRGLNDAWRLSRDSGSDPEGGDALAAPGAASQSGGAEGDASPSPLSRSNPNAN